MISFGEALNELLVSHGMTPYKLCKLAKIPDSSISQILNGKKRPTDDILRKIARLPELNVSYETLASWRLKDDYSEEAIIQAQVSLGMQSSIQNNHHHHLTPELQYQSVEGVYRFPCKGSVSAGLLKLQSLTEDIEYYEFMDIKEYDPELFCLKIEGTSMEPEFKHGGVILVRPAKAVHNHRVYVVQTVEKKSTLKVMRFYEDGAVLTPLNPAHDPISLKNVDINRLFEVIEYKKSYL